MGSLHTYPRHAFTGQLTAFDYESISLDAVTAKGLTAAKLAAVAKQQAPVRVLITVETAAIRYRVDGQADPTAAEGHELFVTGYLDIEGVNNLSQVRFISKAGAAVVKVTYSRYEA